ncbi:Glutamine-trna ligase, partial [Globisporangium splendens]
MATATTTTTTTTNDALEARALSLAENTPEMLAEHARVTQGKVRTRFPPEPNGYLHVGHAKSMHMNFYEAFEKLGVPVDARETYFRYDDTNPEAESDEYIQAIADTIKWLGYSPSKVTYSSEYFPELYALAIKLIKKGKAYVCHQSKPEIEASRIVLQQFHSTPGPKKESDLPEAAKSPFRSRSVEENLVEFEKMRVGLYGEGEASLRMKMDLASPNPNMWDHVAYRIKFVPHPHIGDKWCIYPTYDYTHCIVDALEHIDYSICTLEFETRRESYYWLLDELDLYKPKVYEFARLSMTYTVLSKRKLLKLVTSKMVRGWDDPRMGTLNGLKRRGFTPEIIKQFCKEIGVTRVQSTIQIERFYSVARGILGDQSKRVLAVLDPVEVVIENFEGAPSKDALTFKVPDYPQDVERDGGNAFHHITLSKSIYLDRSDVRVADSKDFYGLAMNKQVRLKYAYNFTCTKMDTDADGKVTKVYGVVDFSTDVKPPKGILSWVPATSPSLEVRVYSHLFKVPELPAVADWESFVDSQHSEVVYKNARMDPESYAKNLKDGEAVQFERLGYFVTDKDSTSKRKVLNQIIPLREASSLAQSDDKAKVDGAVSNSRKDAQAAQLALKLEKMKTSPLEMFKSQVDLYSQFDAEGLPTHDAAGVPLTKSQVKKLKKDQDKQKKLHESYLAQQKA